MIRKLADKWHNDIGIASHKNPELICANQLRAALPKWTRITDSPDTWPEEYTRVMFSGGKEPHFDTFDSDYISEWMGVFWRDICDLDLPEQES